VKIVDKQTTKGQEVIEDDISHSIVVISYLDAYICDKVFKVILGRGVIYLVIDTGSSQIVGVSIGIEPISWSGLKRALLNCTESKVQICSKLGINITEEQWPKANMPKYLVLDKSLHDVNSIQKGLHELGINFKKQEGNSSRHNGRVERVFTKLCKNITYDTEHEQNQIVENTKYRVVSIEETYRFILKCIIMYNSHK
jgi:hypothetical protein